MSKKKKGIKSFFPINFGSFSGTCLVSCGLSIKYIRKHLKKNKNGDWRKGLKETEEFSSTQLAWGIRIKVRYKKADRHLYYILLKNPWKYTEENYITLAHEAVHICQFVLRDIMNRDEEIECEAYLHSHIMTQVLNKIKTL